MSEKKCKKEEVRQILLELIKNDTEIRSQLHNILSKSEDKINYNSPSVNSDNEHNESELTEYKKQIQNSQNIIADKENEIKSLNERAESDQKVILHYKNENSYLNSKSINLENANEELQSEIIELKNKIKALESIKFIYEVNFCKLYDIYTNYKSLGEEITESFKAIVNINSPLSFLLSLSNADNLKLFFERVHIEWNKYSASTLDTLNQVFDFAFEQFSINNPEYHRIKTKIGENFDTDNHMRTSDSPPVGTVKKVIISGYTNETGTKKIKSFVEIG
jgi:chromosome segregation ATPase